ncbi:hypothetical protein BDV40DRAFT_107328 [Aspergillus tamarii]|uniref:Uncharacterized protein n=1 Tax=Aspergillus tamarii TaxID=41984 RepID=A0A5N6V195_ASPTM|nr:hypothetical protein BDV40DRAFT_107328 [Aspergillus tamarii]
MRRRICSPRYRSIHTLSAIFPAMCGCCIPYLTVLLAFSTDSRSTSKDAAIIGRLAHRSGQPHCGTLTFNSPPIGLFSKPRPRVRSFQEPCHPLGLLSFVTSSQVGLQFEEVSCQLDRTAAPLSSSSLGKFNDDFGKAWKPRICGLRKRGAWSDAQAPPLALKRVRS